MRAHVNTTRRALSIATLLTLPLAASACGSEGSVVYVENQVTPTTSGPVVVPATTLPPATLPTVTAPQTLDEP